MIGAFTGEQAETRYLAAYDAVARHWPVPVRDLDVRTRFGPTRVRASGESGPALVLLPGIMGTSLSWYPHVAALAERHRVYAVDTIGEPGRSRQTAPVLTNDDCAQWLTEVLDGLGHDQARFAGVSRGGWLALNLAIRAPARVAGVTAFEPAGFAHIGSGFIRWSLGEMLRWLRPRAPGDVRRVLRPLLFGGLRYRAHHPPQHLFTDDELRAITAPTRIVLAERSVIHPAREVAARIGPLNPLVDVEVVRHATHALSLQRPELVTRRVLDG